MFKPVKTIALFLLGIIGVFMCSCSSQSNKKEVNNLLDTNFLENNEILLFESTSENDNCYAIEIKIENNKLEKLLESKPKTTYMDYEMYEEIIKENISSDEFSKDLSLCDEEYQFLYRTEKKGRKGIFEVTRLIKTYAHLYVYTIDDNYSFVCIRLYSSKVASQ